MNLKLLLILFLLAVNSFAQKVSIEAKTQIQNVLAPTILQKASQILKEKPITITSFPSKRSAGGIHDFHSEGDYWWPNPSDHNGPYIQKDGLSNPENFVKHRELLMKFSMDVGTLCSAFLINKEKKYAKKINQHLKAWFINPATRMNPSLLYAQAIKGRVTGRGIGIIDMIQMIEVAQSIIVLEKYDMIPDKNLVIVKKWFSDYLIWVNSHPYGLDEKNALNNHGTCWTMQVAAFAKLTNSIELLELCKKRYKELHLVNQMATDGSFPLELKRTKPYGYSLFNLDAIATTTHILEITDYKTNDGKSLKSGAKYLFPFVANKENWPYPKDVMYWNNWPVAHPFLLFYFINFKEKEYFDLWKKLDHFPTEHEVLRNLPIRNPIIFLE